MLGGGGVNLSHVSVVLHYLLVKIYLIWNARCLSWVREAATKALPPFSSLVATNLFPSPPPPYMIRVNNPKHKIIEKQGNCQYKLEVIDRKGKSNTDNQTKR